jgi:hypothetical protein
MLIHHWRYLMLRSWMLGGLCGLLVASASYAKLGVVKTRDGQTFEGEITESPDQVIIERKGIRTTLERESIRTISYSESIEQEYQKRLAKLSAYDVRGRIELAQWVFQNKAYALALDVLTETQKLQPRNQEVADMIRTVDRQMYLDQREARKHTPVQLVANDRDPRTTTAPTSRPAPQRATRVVTPDEINLIRQEEWHGPDQPVRVTFKDDVRRTFVVSQKYNPTEFNRGTPVQQAWAILQNGSPEMKKDVIIANDPPVLNAFRTIQTSLLSACANCHAADKHAGNFVLRWPALTDADRFTNFVVLQQYATKVGDRTYSMIDRDRPQDSLLLQFALPPAVGAPGHPNVANYRGVVKSLSDPRASRTFEWINALNLQKTLDYNDIDLSTGGAPAPGTPAAPRPAPEPVHPATAPARGR